MLKRVNLIGIEGKMNTFFFTGIHFRIEWNSRGRQFNSVQLHQIFKADSSVESAFFIARRCTRESPDFPFGSVRVHGCFVSAIC